MTTKMLTVLDMKNVFWFKHLSKIYWFKNTAITDLSLKDIKEAYETSFYYNDGFNEGDFLGFLHQYFDIEFCYFNEIVPKNLDTVVFVDSNRGATGLLFQRDKELT